MDDSDHDFVDLCSKLLKRVRKNPVEAQSDKDMKAKDKVLLRMQQFKRAIPQKLAHNDKTQPTNHVTGSSTAENHRQDALSCVRSDPHSEPLNDDEALALQLQQELDCEAAEAQLVDIEDGGLFFCQICHRDLSHMTLEGRTQHLNRCLDESEQSAPPPPPPSGVPDCPICGKKFKSQKSRSAHLKRCSSEMGVTPAVLLQALQRQAQESQSTATTLIQTVGTKRKVASKSGLPVRKKPKKKTEQLDEETMVALALSTSMLEQEKEQLGLKEAERHLQRVTASSHSSMTPALKWQPDAGKGRGNRKKAAIPRPPPLLLIQDAEAALTRLQERVSALLLHKRASSPPTPTFSPSTLPGWTGAAPLWQKSAVLDGSFYTAELKEFFIHTEAVPMELTSLKPSNRRESSVQPVGGGTPSSGTRVSILPSCSEAVSCSSVHYTPGTGQLPVGSQTLRDLMELAEDGMTLTQYGYSAKDKRLSGFIQEESEEAELCASGFLLETTHKPSKNTLSQTVRATDQPGAEDRSDQQSAALSRLTADLSSMVNNPQLSDVQLQVDSGEVYFAHSFMVYARCPLLAEMVHENGFGVQEEGVPAAQRVLLSDVPGQAVFTLLQYLYTTQCSITASLQPHILELASRFDLKELEQLCHLHREEAAALVDEAHEFNQEEHPNNQTDQAFMELLQSMWNEEDEDDKREDSDGGGDEGDRVKEDHRADGVTSSDREVCEEQVNEEELEEIYEFAATQKKRQERDSEEDEEEKDRKDEEQNGDMVFTKLRESNKNISKNNLNPDLQPDPDLRLDCSYSCLFSQSWGTYKEDDSSSSASDSDPPKTSPPQFKQPQSPNKSSSKVSARTPPPIIPNLPVIGLSPGQVDDAGQGGHVREEALQRESQGPRSICIPLSPDSLAKKEEPELIVLSDSSEEMEHDGAVVSSSRLSPHLNHNLQTYTEVKSRQRSLTDAAALENEESRYTELSPCDPPDCSPEVSWLIPSTPVQPGRSMTASSTQTKSSMCRMKLFPKFETSTPSSSVFSSSVLPLQNKHNTSSSQHKYPASSGRAESGVSRSKLKRTPLRSSNSDPKVFPEKSKDIEMIGVKPSQPNQSHLSSLMHHHSLQASLKQDTPLHLLPQPCSSTPLHPQLHQLPVLPATSPLHTDTDKQDSFSQIKERTPSESPEKTELGSFYFSPLSNPSDPPSSSSHSGHQDSNGQSKSCSLSGCPDESSSVDNKEARNKREKREVDFNNEDDVEEQKNSRKKERGEMEEANLEESDFQNSFMAMDEPPIAFNDSWGLDVCAEANPGCFSLRLEDSRGSRGISPTQREPARSSSSCISKHVTTLSPQSHSPQPSSSLQANTGPSFTSSQPHPNTPNTPEIDNCLLDPKIWDSWEEEKGDECLPLSQRVNPSVLHKTPVTHNKKRRSLVPITPMPHYSDMDTPELKNKLNRFGVRPLPKRQMVLKLKEIHQYTHQLASSDSEDDFEGGTALTKPPASRGISYTQKEKFKEPRAPAAVSPVKPNREEDIQPLSASQSSNTSSTAASEESERSNPELLISSDGDSDSDGGISSSQAASRLKDRLQAVRSFILSDSKLYNQILQYQPLVLSQLQEQLKAAGIRLAAAKLVDYLDSQCITFTTAKPGHSAPGRRRGKKPGKAAQTGSRKKVAAALL
ncbi:structure-specific endonuclease subunit SLX4 isoform X2 [Melanotaenia boesemani]|uniref:structure-specific endonuclease subunit SLX4 isoform X2 n=1 Tax=Melanotaenia boesemani TaxID=1250792 RepID=UPI001C04773C|nr:structure-specific endonuclease subunit SLX4 isoform X2 [Melanotaenia boesemani]